MAYEKPNQRFRFGWCDCLTIIKYYKNIEILQINQQFYRKFNFHSFPIQ